MLFGGRSAKPLESLKKAEALFRDRMSAIVDACNHDKVCLASCSTRLESFTFLDTVR